MLSTKSRMSAFVAELLGHGEAGQRHAQTVAGGLVHLAEHHRDLVENVGLLHLVVEVVALAGTLAHAGEHRVAAVADLAMLLISSIMFTVLPTPAPPNRPTLPPLANGQIRSITLMPVGSSSAPDGRQLVELRGLLVDRSALVGQDRAGFVDRATQHVHDAAQGAGCRPAPRWACRCWLDRHAAAQAVGRTQRDGAHDAVAELLLYFEGQTGFGVAGIGFVEGQGS
jgi:hypothetical protein